MNAEDIEHFRWLRLRSEDKVATLCINGSVTPAVLTMVGVVDKDGTSVAPHGTYTRPTRQTPSLLDVRLTVSLVKPSSKMSPFHSCFVTGLRVIESLIGLQCNKTVGWKTSGLSAVDLWRRPNDVHTIIFTHKLFEPVEEGDFPFLEKEYMDHHKVLFLTARGLNSLCFSSVVVVVFYPPLITPKLFSLTWCPSTSNPSPGKPIRNAEIGDNSPSTIPVTSVGISAEDDENQAKPTQKLTFICWKGRLKGNTS
ncbi:hypothetical protein PM082_005406 [Marasmius tenuissimus]|nr:hypothetical protein PM082_005406 [Marasmius tenuissimus]